VDRLQPDLADEDVHRRFPCESGGGESVLALEALDRGLRQLPEAAIDRSWSRADQAK
jgi:hypothetical protein